MATANKTLSVSFANLFVSHASSNSSHLSNQSDSQSVLSMINNSDNIKIKFKEILQANSNATIRQALKLIKQESNQQFITKSQERKIKLTTSFKDYANNFQNQEYESYSPIMYN